MTEQENRLYAVDLLNRSLVTFDACDIAILAKVLGTIEGDIAAWLDGQLRTAVSRTLITRDVRDGKYRPALIQPPVSGKPEGNLK